MWRARRTPLPAARMLACVCTFVLGPLSVPADEPLRSNEAILDLPPDLVERHVPIEIDGVLLMVDPEGRYIVHDGHRAIFACNPDPGRPQAKPGDKVQIKGTSMPGLFAPVIDISTMVSVGPGELPAPIKTRLAGLMDPSMNPQWVEIEALVRSAAPRPGYPGDTVLEVTADELRVPVVLSGVLPAAAMELIDAQVRIRAFCFHDTNRRRQLLAARLLVPKGEPVTVLAPAPTDPYSLPVQAPSDLLQYSRTPRKQNRVHLQGVVSQSTAQRTFYLQDKGEGIEIRSAHEVPPVPGSRVDVVGFVGRGTYGPILEDAEFRVVAPVAHLVPKHISPDEAIDANSTLVEMTGQLENAILDAGGVSLVLRDGEDRFVARLPRTMDGKIPWPMQSQLKVTGICRAKPEPVARNEFAWISGPFDLLVRSQSDVVVLDTPPWWTRPEAGRFATVALLLAAIASIILFVRYRAKAKAEGVTRLAAEREFDAVLKERSRVAREIHDTLAQGLTSISAQLELARQNAEGRAPSALGHIDLAREFVRASLAEARRSVWALRPQVLENMQLAPALGRIANELTAGTDVEVQLKANGELDSLPPFIENELLRVGQEALTNAVRHGTPRKIQIQLQDLAEEVRLHISDDGKGFDTERTRRSARNGYGISGMQERVHLLNGRFRLQSKPGSGTRIEVEIPKL